MKKENLEMLIELTSGEDTVDSLRAELYRHLSQFDKACENLSTGDDENYTPYAGQLLKACEDGNVEAVKLMMPGFEPW